MIRFVDEFAARLRLPSRIEAIRRALRAQIDITPRTLRNPADQLLDVLKHEMADRFRISRPEALGCEPNDRLTHPHCSSSGRGLYTGQIARPSPAI